MIKSLFIASEVGGKLQKLDSIQVVAGAGIVGDRNFNKSKWPGQNITFISQESIEAFNRNYHQSIDLGATRRNVVTAGVDLNALVGKTFSICGVVFKGVELCEPCKDLGDDLMNDTISSAEVVNAFVHSGGLRAEVYSDGVLSVGMTFTIEESSK